LPLAPAGKSAAEAKPANANVAAATPKEMGFLLMEILLEWIE
jgi:hypothetical protein